MGLCVCAGAITYRSLLGPRLSRAALVLARSALIAYLYRAKCSRKEQKFSFARLETLLVLLSEKFWRDTQAQHAARDATFYYFFSSVLMCCTFVSDAESMESESRIVHFLWTHCDAPFISWCTITRDAFLNLALKIIAQKKKTKVQKKIAQHNKISKTLKNWQVVFHVFPFVHIVTSPSRLGSFALSSTLSHLHHQLSVCFPLS